MSSYSLEDSQVLRKLLFLLRRCPQTVNVTVSVSSFTAELSEVVVEEMKKAV